MPKISATFMKGFLILKRILDITYDTDNTKNAEMIHEKIEIINVLTNICGKLNTLVVSVKSFL